jgi:hypothetical protein
MSYAQTNTATNIGQMLYYSSNEDVTLVNDEGTSTDLNFLKVNLVAGIYSIRGNYNSYNKEAVICDIKSLDFGIFNNAEEELSQQQLGISLDEDEGWQFAINAILE